MNTAQMWTEAQTNNNVYISESLAYSRAKGFHGIRDKSRWNPNSFSNFTDTEGNYGFDAFMNVDWEKTPAKKTDYVCTLTYDDYVMNMIIKAECQEDASEGFRKYIDEYYIKSEGVEIRVRPLELIKVMEV